MSDEANATSMPERNLYDPYLVSSVRIYRIYHINMVYLCLYMVYYAFPIHRKEKWSLIKNKLNVFGHL